MKSTTMNLRNPKAGLEALLTPDNCLLTLIDHQPFQFANLHSHEPTMVVNNVISLAKTAKVFGEPAILTTVLEERVGFLIKGLRFWLMGTICIAALTGCAHSKQAGAYGKAKPSGFLKDYSKLRAAADETEPTLVYVRPDKAKFKSYTKIWLEPVQVWRGEKSEAKDLDKDDATHLSQFLWSRLDEELRKDYAIVQAPGPDVMRLRVGITEAGKNIPVLDNLTAAIPMAMVLSKGKKYIGGTEAFVGKATIEGELADSQTGELLTAGVDRRGGGKYAWKSLERWGDVEAALTYWAKKSRWRACLLRGDTKCEKPEK